MTFQITFSKNHWNNLVVYLNNHSSNTLNNFFKPMTNNFSNSYFKQPFNSKPIPTWPKSRDEQIIMENHLLTIYYNAFIFHIYFYPCFLKLSIVKINK